MHPKSATWCQNAPTNIVALGNDCCPRPPPERLGVTFLFRFLFGTSFCVTFLPAGLQGRRPSPSGRARDSNVFDCISGSAGGGGAFKSAGGDRQKLVMPPPAGLQATYMLCLRCVYCKYMMCYVYGMYTASIWYVCACSVDFAADFSGQFAHRRNLKARSTMQRTIL